MVVKVLLAMLRESLMVVKVLLAMLGVLVIAAVALYIFIQFRGPSARPSPRAATDIDTTARPSPPPPSPPVPVQDHIELVGTQQIVAAYEANEVSADAFFTKHVVRIVGVVHAIEKSITGHPFVKFGRGGVRQVMCKFDDDSPYPATMKKGDLNLLECVGAGMGPIKSVHFEHCTMIETAPLLSEYPTLLARDRKDPTKIVLAGALKRELED